MLNELSLQQGASQLQTISANLWTFSINIIYLLSIHFPSLNFAQIYHYLIARIVLLAVIKFERTFGFSSAVALV
jgi:hypothetical protein